MAGFTAECVPRTMTTMGRPKAALILTDDERKLLQSFARKRKAHAAMSLRAKIVLRCADGIDNIDVAEELGISNNTVGKWRKRFVEQRLDGLFDEPRVGRPRSVSDEDVARTVDATLHETPVGRTHWSTRSLSEKLDLSKDAISRIWKAFGLRPHRSENFSLSNDPQFIEKVRDIVGLYMCPPTNAVVLCVDEKSQMQALNRTQPLLPMTPGELERRTCTYERNGTTTLFAALEVASGRVISKTSPRHRSKEFRAFLKQIDRNVPKELDVHLILDNLATHKTKEVHDWLLRHSRFHLHFTPTYSSWLNLVESFFSIVQRRVSQRGVHRSVRELERDIRACIEAHNENPKPFVWTKSADEILESLKRYCLRAGAVRDEKKRRQKKGN